MRLEREIPCVSGPRGGRLTRTEAEAALALADAVIAWAASVDPQRWADTEKKWAAAVDRRPQNNKEKI